MSITGELREWTVNHRAELNAGQLYPAMIEAIADRIDEQYSVKVERLEKYRAAVDAMLKEYVKLPVDADWVPIHVGDELTDGKVARLLICDDAEENSVYVYESPHVIKQIYCYEVVHRKPDSWEGIISDAVILGRQLEWLDNSRGDAGSERELVERCRRLAGERA